MSRSIQPAGIPGRRPRGDSPATCMVIIVVAIVGGIWGYYHFLHNRSLERAGQDIIIIEGADQEAKNNYLRRMKDPILPGVRAVGTETNTLIMEVTSGKKKKSPELMDQITRMEDRLREQIGNVNGQGVPKEWMTYHRTLAQAVGSFWKGLVALREGLEAEEAGEKKKLFVKARNESGKGMKDFQISQNTIMSLFGR